MGDMATKVDKNPKVSSPILKRGWNISKSRGSRVRIQMPSGKDPQNFDIAESSRTNGEKMIISERKGTSHVIKYRNGSRADGDHLSIRYKMTCFKRIADYPIFKPSYFYYGHFYLYFLTFLPVSSRFYDFINELAYELIGNKYISIADDVIHNFLDYIDAFIGFFFLPFNKISEFLINKLIILLMPLLRRLMEHEKVQAIQTSNSQIDESNPSEGSSR